MNTMYRSRPWYKRKRTWFLLVMLLGLGTFISSLPAELPVNIVYLVKGYSEPEICEGAFEITKNNPEVVALLGELEPMGSLDMLNGSVQYSKGGDSIAITISIFGAKEIKGIRSKMDLMAVKMDGNWEYQKVRVRIKQPPELRQKIEILDKRKEKRE